MSSGDEHTLSVEDDALNIPKVFRLYLKLAEIRNSTLCARYGYHDLRRFFAPDPGSGDDEYGLAVLGNDPLATLLAAGLKALPRNDRKSRAPCTPLDVRPTLRYSPGTETRSPACSATWLRNAAISASFWLTSRNCPWRSRTT